MDTLTQGLLGAAAAQATVDQKPGRRVWLYGALGGMAADLDVFSELASDPMIGFRFHRHFTHSLAFIPIGGLIVALPFILKRKDRGDWRAILLAATVGYATHAPLDVFTSYGTLLLWPFSDMRLALDFVSIVDPIVSLILLIGVVLSARRVRARPARVALLTVLGYLGFGGVQHSRAVTAVELQAQARGHVPTRIRALPLVLSNLRWRTFYEAGGTVYIYSVTAPWFGSTSVRRGSSYALFSSADLPAAARDDPRTETAFRQFVWFADGWVGRTPDDPSAISDMRYSRVPLEVVPMWGIRLRPGAEAPVELVRRTPTVKEVLRSIQEDGE